MPSRKSYQWNFSSKYQFIAHAFPFFLLLEKQITNKYKNHNRNTREKKAPVRFLTTLSSKTKKK